MPRIISAVVERAIHGEHRLVGRLQQIDLHRIATGVLPDTLPNDFVESVRRFGLLQPIIVVDDPSQHLSYRLVAGRRRVAAALRTTMLYVPAIIFPAGTPDSVLAAMSLTENYQRRENPIADMEAIDELVAAGVAEVEIADRIGLSISQVRSRRALAHLIQSMRNALQNGDLSVRLANQIARMPASSQRALWSIWCASDGDEITPEMVERATNEHDAASAMDTVVDMTRPERTPITRTVRATASLTPEMRDILLAPSIRRIDENLIEADGQQFIRFTHHQHMVRNLEQGLRNAVQAIGQTAMASMPSIGAEPVAGTAMVRIGETTYITLEEHNRLVTQATRRARPVGTAQRTMTEAQVQELVEAARRDAHTQAQATRAPIAAGLTREEIIERVAAERSYGSAVALIEAASRALPAEPNRRSDELHEAVGLVHDMIQAVA